VTDETTPRGDHHEPIDHLLEEMIAQQRAKVLALARSLDPRLTGDDILSPDDFPGLSSDPRFAYEDGILAGLLSARAAIRARSRGESG
jgi:hypothetical protein